MRGVLRLQKSATGQRTRRVLACAGVVVALAAGATGCRAFGSSSNQGSASTTVTYALPANQVPNYIFPFVNANYFTVIDTNYFQFLMYRPLYWFGKGHTPDMNDQLSLAYPPVYHGQVVTIRMRPFKWSTGAPVSARDVVFWLNMMIAETPPHVKQANWGGYVPNALPNNIKDVHAIGTNEVQMTVIGKYSHTWFTDNELSQITPMPQQWDRTSATATAHCTDKISDCAGVYKYLDSLSANSKTWVTNPLWQIVDGPWRLTGLSSQGILTFKINPQYSLPLPSGHITEFQELPYTTEAAEFNILQAGGGGGQQIDVGYLPTVDAPVPLPGAAVGANPVPGYQLSAVYPWELTYAPYNFNPADPARALINQVYIRQALQYLVNQAQIVAVPLHGYGKISDGLVGDFPQTRFLSATALRGDPFPYNPYKASRLLTTHGWQIVNGVATCVNPGRLPTQCGPGIGRNRQLVLTYDYESGTAWIQSAVQQLVSNAAQIGIKINTTPWTFNDLIGRTYGNCGPQKSSPCPWEIANWGGGWTYAPDYLPTPEELFQTSAVGNTGQYSNAKDDSLIARTLVTNGQALYRAMWTWQDYLTPKVPVMLQPESVGDLIETVNNLHIGVQAPTLQITPEYWYYSR